MSKSDRLNKQSAGASRSRAAQKVLDSDRRFIDDPVQVRFLTSERIVIHVDNKALISYCRGRSGSYRSISSLAFSYELMTDPEITTELFETLLEWLGPDREKA